MAKNNRRSSSKAARKQAGIQRGIGNKTAKELQEAAAAVKAQTTAKRQEVVCEPQQANPAGDKDDSSIPDCLSDVYSSDLSPPTPELVPASPSGLSTGSFETATFSTSDDEVPISLEAACSQPETLGDLDEPLDAHPAQEALNISGAAQEATTLITHCATAATLDAAITATDLIAAEVPALRHNKYTWELSPEAQARVEAEEGCICSGVWTFEVSDDMALAEASLAELLPVPNARADDITIKPSECMLDLLPAETQVDAAQLADATLPPPGLDNLEAQVFAEADEMCTGPDLWACDFITATVGADMTELRPLCASDAADASDRDPVSPSVVQQEQAATAAKKEAPEPGALVQELTGSCKEKEPDTHKPKGMPSAQEHATAPPAAPPCSWPAALALHACSHLQAASAHRWVQPKKFACVRLPLQLVAVAGVEATAITDAVCQYAMSFVC
ncbi:g7256 [Coccomyxa elongata]